MECHSIANYKQRMVTGLVTMVDRYFSCQVSGQLAEDWLMYCLTLSDAGLLIVCHVTGVSLSPQQKAEMIRYLRNVQLSDGGWGL